MPQSMMWLGKSSFTIKMEQIQRQRLLLDMLTLAVDAIFVPFRISTFLYLWKDDFCLFPNGLSLVPCIVQGYTTGLDKQEISA